MQRFTVGGRLLLSAFGGSGVAFLPSLPLLGLCWSVAAVWLCCANIQSDNLRYISVLGGFLSVGGILYRLRPKDCLNTL